MFIPIGHLSSDCHSDDYFTCSVGFVSVSFSKLCIRQNERICIYVCVCVCMCGTRIKNIKASSLVVRRISSVLPLTTAFDIESLSEEREIEIIRVFGCIFSCQFTECRWSVGLRATVYVHFQAKQKFPNIQHSCQFIQSKQFVCGCHRVYIDIAKIERKTITTNSNKKTDLFI